MEFAPEVDVLKGLRDPERAVDVTNPGMLLKALADHGASLAPARYEGEKARGELGNGLALEPVVGPKEAGFPISEMPGCGSAEEARCHLIHRELKVMPRPRGVSGFEPKPAAA